MSPFQKDFAKGMNQAEGQTKTLGQKMATALNPKSLLLGLGGGILGSQVISFFSDATNAAAEYADTVGASGVIFDEEFTPALEAWAEEAHSAFGASKQDALAAANVFATLGKSAGKTGQELVDFSTEMVQLGGDLASFFGGSTEEAINAVGAALRGESEPIRRYGVLLDDATLRARAFEMGLISTTKNALTPQQRVLAAHAEILEQTSDAQGDFVRTSDGMANIQRDLAAEMENLTIEIGEQLLPIMRDLALFVKDVGIPVIRSLSGEFRDAGEAASEGDWIGAVDAGLNNIAQSASDAGVAVHDWILGSKGAEDVAEDIDHAAAAYDDSALRAEQMAFRVNNAYELQGEAASDLSEQTEEEMAAIAKAAEEAHEQAVDEIATMFDELIDLFEGRKDFRDAVKDFHDMINNPWPDTRRRAAIEAVLASEEVREGLRSEDSHVRAETIEFVNGLVEEYETLAPGALAAGELVNPELQEGLQRNLAQTLRVAEGIAIATGNELDFREWAERAGLEGLLSFSKGMNSQRSTATRTALDIAKAARDEMYFNAYGGGQSSARTFVDGIKAVLYARSTTLELQQAMQYLKIESFGGSLPRSGPFSRRPLAEGAISIGQFWIDVLTDTVNRRLDGLRGFSPSIGARVPAASGTAGQSSSSSGVRDIHVHLEDKMPPVTKPSDIAGHLRRAGEVGLLR